jgi:hypothetical protein
MSLIVIPTNKLAIIQPVEVFDVNYNCAAGETKVYEDTRMLAKHNIFLFVGQNTQVTIDIHTIKQIAYWTRYNAALAAFGQYELIMGVEPFAVRITLQNLTGAPGGWSVWWYAMNATV